MEAGHRGMVEKSHSPKQVSGCPSMKVTGNTQKPGKVIHKPEKELLINNFSTKPKVCGQIIQ